MFIVEHCFLTQSYETVEQPFQAHFYNAAVPESSETFIYLLTNSSTLSRFSTNIIRRAELRLCQDGSHFQDSLYLNYVIMSLNM